MEILILKSLIMMTMSTEIYSIAVVRSYCTVWLGRRSDQGIKGGVRQEKQGEAAEPAACCCYTRSNIKYTTLQVYNYKTTKEASTWLPSNYRYPLHVLWLAED